MRYMTVSEAAAKWGLSVRSVQLHCLKGNVPGVNLKGKAWQIPEVAEKPSRKPRQRKLPCSILEVLKGEKRGRIAGGLYHQLQIDFTYNTNHMEGSRLTHEQTRWIFETQTVGKLPSDVPVDDIVETANHFRCIERIHPFQDGNGRIGRLILLKECLKHNLTPFVIAENLRQFYYLGLRDWRKGRHARLLETCRTGQDVFILGLKKFGHAILAEKAEAAMSAGGAD